MGPKLPAEVVTIPYQPAVVEQDGTLKGTIPILDVQYGNVWTNIDDSLLTKAGIHKGTTPASGSAKGCAEIRGQGPYVSSFGDVPEGQPWSTSTACCRCRWR